MDIVTHTRKQYVITLEQGEAAEIAGLADYLQEEDFEGALKRARSKSAKPSLQLIRLAKTIRDELQQK